MKITPPWCTCPRVRFSERPDLERTGTMVHGAQIAGYEGCGKPTRERWENAAERGYLK